MKFIQWYIDRVRGGMDAITKKLFDVDMPEIRKIGKEAKARAEGKS